MRRILIGGFALVVAAIAVGPASASHPGENSNTVTFTINCGDAGTFTGSLLGGSGGALHLEGGGLAIAQGLAEADGTVIAEPTPGLEQQGRLVQCRFTFPGQPERIAFVQFAPTNP